MGLTRRTVLKTLLASGVASSTPASAMQPSPPPAHDRTTLLCFVDTLIPADAHSPGAAELGIADALLSAAEGSAYGRLIDKGCAWLNRQAKTYERPDFSKLEEAARIAAVRQAEAAPKNSLENVFFRAVLDDLMGRYYADPRAWPGIGYAGPPQPVGFPDFTRPPNL